ncbi:MAG: SpoIIE family protein phosphatase [Coriobacteriia bacterium]
MNPERIGASIIRENFPGFTLEELLDPTLLRPMLEDFYQLTRIPVSLVDIDGQILVGAGWQHACTDFHRVHPDSCAHCTASDTILTADIEQGETKVYKCENGMWDAATPLYVGSKRAGYLFTGQFFFDDEAVDLEFFREQALRYGFDEAAYFHAIASAPRLSRDAVRPAASFLEKLSTMLSRLGYANLERARTEADLQIALEAQTTVATELSAERSVLHAIMENTETHLAYLDSDLTFVAVNSAFAKGSGYSKSRLIGRNHFDLFPNAENQEIFERARDSGQRVEYRAKPFCFEGQPWRGVTYWDWRLTPVKDRDGQVRGLSYSLLDVTASIRQRGFSDAINRLNDVIHSNLEFEAILEQSVPELAAPMGCEVVVALLRAPDGLWRLEHTHGLTRDLRSPTFTDDEVPHAVGAVRWGRPVAVTPEDIAESGGGIADLLGIQSMLIAPLSSAGATLGAVLFGYVSGPGQFDEYAIDFAGKTAASLSLALNNARMYENEHRIADRLQEALLALPDQIEGLQFAHAYHSASEAARVGGDFYDIFELDDRHVGVTIGDVTGKGLDAAVLTSLAKDTIRAHACESGKSPARILALTSDVIHRATDTETFVTLFFGLLNCETGVLVYANAGHPVPLILGRRGIPTSLETTGPPAGAFRGSEFDQAQSCLEPQDILFLYTDGLTEARDPASGMYGDQRLIDLLSGGHGETAFGVVDAVIVDVLAFAGGRLTDDLAILAVKRLTGS